MPNFAFRDLGLAEGGMIRIFAKMKSVLTIPKSSQEVFT